MYIYVSVSNRNSFDIFYFYEAIEQKIKNYKFKHFNRIVDFCMKCAYKLHVPS